jgi:predicted GNAT family N-acyltransferase
LSKEVQNTNLFQQVAVLLKNAQQQVFRAVNSTMVYTYFEIGRVIVEEEQNGNERAEYGKQILKGLSEQLTKEFGKGFSVDNLQNMRKFYLTYSNYETLSSISEDLKIKSETISTEFVNSEEQMLISFLMRIDNEIERSFYEIKTVNNNWILV